MRTRLLPALAALTPLPALGAAQGAVLGGGGQVWQALAVLGALGCGLAGFWALRLRRRLHSAAERNARLSAANAMARDAADRAAARAQLLDGVLHSLADGVAVVDADLRLIGWNTRFPEFSGVPASRLRVGLTMEEMIRLQAESGEFGLVNPDEAIRSRIERLKAGRFTERWQRERPDGSRLELRRTPLRGGGFVTLYTPLEPTRPGLPLTEEFLAEWTSRLPRLVAAAADGDLPALREAAHALRGIAANAGWPHATVLLERLETAAAAGDLPGARGLAATLDPENPA